MALQHGRRRGFEPVRMAREIRARPTPMFGRVARQVHAVNRKHLAANEALLVTHGQDRDKDARDILAQRAHELRDRGEVRRALATERGEGHVLLAGPLDLTAAHNPLRVRQEHDLEQQRRWIGWRAGRVVLEPGIDLREVDRVVQPVIQRVLERSGQELPGQIHGGSPSAACRCTCSGPWRTLDSGAIRHQIRCQQHRHSRASFVST